jgi:hypothetical protein
LIAPVTYLPDLGQGDQLALPGVAQAEHYSIAVECWVVEDAPLPPEPEPAPRYWSGSDLIVELLDDTGNVVRRLS